MPLLEDNPDVKNFLTALIFVANKRFSSQKALPTYLTPQHWSFQINNRFEFNYCSKYIHGPLIGDYHRILDSLLGQIPGLTVSEEWRRPSADAAKFVITITEDILQHIQVRRLDEPTTQYMRQQSSRLNMVRDSFYVEIILINPNVERTIWFIGRDSAGVLSHFFEMSATEHDVLMAEYQQDAIRRDDFGAERASQQQQLRGSSLAPIGNRVQASAPPVYEPDGLLTLPSGLRCHPSEVSTLFQQMLVDISVLRAHLPPAPPYSDQPAPGQ
jgi:hypothetical protein